MTSVARVEANRQNAKKSTGPRTAAGKERTRLNGLKHGLRAEEAVLPTEDKALFDDHMAAWADDWRPPTVTRRHLVERAGLAAWRLKRCARVETDRLSDRVEKARNKWDFDRNRRLDNLTRQLADSPVEATLALERSRGGVERLVDAWERLIAAADEPGGWIDRDDHHEFFVGLRSADPGLDGEDDDEVLVSSWELLITSRPDDEPPLDDGPTIRPLDEARAAGVRRLIVKICRIRIAKLRRLWGTLPDDTIERDRHAESSAFDPRPEDPPFQRYEARHDREARAAIMTLIALHKSGADLEDESEVPLMPTVSGEPSPVAEPAAELPTEPNIPPAVARPARVLPTEPNRPPAVAQATTSLPTEPNADRLDLSPATPRSRPGRPDLAHPGVHQAHRLGPDRTARSISENIKDLSMMRPGSRCARGESAAASPPRRVGTAHIRAVDNEEEGRAHPTENAGLAERNGSHVSHLAIVSGKAQVGQVRIPITDLVFHVHSL